MCLNKAFKIEVSVDEKNQLITWIIDLLNLHDRNFLSIMKTIPTTELDKVSKTI